MNKMKNMYEKQIEEQNRKDRQIREEFERMKTDFMQQMNLQKQKEEQSS